MCPVLRSFDRRVTRSLLISSVSGRYCKYSRELSQTPWIIDGERKTEFSVQVLYLTGYKPGWGIIQDGVYGGSGYKP